MSRTRISEGRGLRAEGRGEHAVRVPAEAPAPATPSALRKGQEGYTLAALIVILTIIAIVIAYTVPEQWSLIMKRERDRQTIFLMKQYARAILAWQMKHNNTVPVSLEQLQEARKPRMLRGDGKWPCPLTGKVEGGWILVPPQALVANVPGQQQQPGGITPGLSSPGSRSNRNNTPPAGAPQFGNQQGATFKLNKELSPPDYKGPFVAVRPNAHGKSFIALNEVEEYSEWVYTVEDLRKEIAARQAALAVR
jgi:type II secretory pathway pseudopilin PulG